MVEFPLGAKPYLWVSQLILVTPARRKSNGSVGKPAFSRYGIRKDPRQQSTWSGIFFLTASLESAETSSIMPCGKFGAEATNRTVFELMRRATDGMWTLYVGDLQSTRCTFIPKYSPAFKKAACAVLGMILEDD